MDAHAYIAIDASLCTYVFFRLYSIFEKIMKTSYVSRQANLTLKHLHTIYYYLGKPKSLLYYFYDVQFRLC